MVFRPAQTYSDPALGGNAQRGFPAPGSGAQSSGKATPLSGDAREPYAPLREFLGTVASWFAARPSGQQRGYPSPGGADQQRPPGSMPNRATMFGGVYQHWTPYYDRGAAAYVPNFGKVLSNPIGAGVFTPNRPQASYGEAGQYANGAIWWSNQVIPTTVNLQGLATPEELTSLLSGLEIQAVVRTTG